MYPHQLVWSSGNISKSTPTSTTTTTTTYTTTATTTTTTTLVPPSSPLQCTHLFLLPRHHSAWPPVVDHVTVRSNYRLAPHLAIPIVYFLYFSSADNSRWPPPMNHMTQFTKIDMCTSGNIVPWKNLGNRLYYPSCKANSAVQCWPKSESIIITCFMVSTKGKGNHSNKSSAMSHNMCCLPEACLTSRKVFGPWVSHSP